MKMLSVSPKQYQEQKQSTQVKCGKRSKYIWFVFGHTQQCIGLICGSGLMTYSWSCLGKKLDAGYPTRSDSCLQILESSMHIASWATKLNKQSKKLSWTHKK